mmetsp:Transcript_9132/g.18371  ORF Transcript_9132/g.18371 Transcript_9132/m.18371 type:complete len:235 (-) Transcript_9132:392-1096(-)
MNCIDFLACPNIRIKSGICMGDTQSSKSLPKSMPRCLMHDVQAKMTPLPLEMNLFMSVLQGWKGSPIKVSSMRYDCCGTANSLLLPLRRKVHTPSPIKANTTVSPSLAAAAAALRAKVIFSALLLVPSTTTMSGTVAAGLRNPKIPFCRAMTLEDAAVALFPVAANSRAVMAARYPVLHTKTMPCLSIHSSATPAAKSFPMGTSTSATIISPAAAATSLPSSSSLLLSSPLVLV